MTRDLPSSWGVKQPGDSPVVGVVMWQSGGGKGMPQEDGAALLSLHGTFSRGRRHQKNPISMVSVLHIWEDLGILESGE